MDFKTLNIQDLDTKIHETAIKKGFWKASSNLNVKRTLIITELAEAVDADRIEKRADVHQFKKEYFDGCSKQSDDYFKEFKQMKFFSNADQVLYADLFQRHVKDTVEDELADTYIRCLDLLVKEYEVWHVKIDTAHVNIKQKIERVVFTDSFPENVYLLLRGAFNDRGGAGDWTEGMCWGIDKIAEIEDIDLQTHIELKMTYNDLREKLHGKTY